MIASAMVWEISMCAYGWQQFLRFMLYAAEDGGGVAYHRNLRGRHGLFRNGSRVGGGRNTSR